MKKLKLKLINDAVIEIRHVKATAITDDDKMASVFNGTAAILYHSDVEVDANDMLFNVDPDFIQESKGMTADGYFAGYYTRIVSAEWV